MKKILFTTLFIILLTSCEYQNWMEYPIPTRIHINNMVFNMNDTCSKQLNVHLIPKKTVGTTNITYKSENDSVAIVDSNGNVTPMGGGFTRVIVTATTIINDDTIKISDTGDVEVERVKVEGKKPQTKVSILICNNK